ncbi:class I SAM-dependent methyltransferase [Marinimicrococcus flavescens]|uniref:Class I SAM-dependent methyltransferase n=1 Tax=Marinimicrococcus flavescens TaxID=3031815 RepID=A0AAP3XRK8_9PROT|nr:class I SAM-dependent methyltransferase [Marinimicrococcus flavescens]
MTVHALASSSVSDRMGRMYRPQKLIYDLTRKPYLLGRDLLIEEMGARPGEAVLEIGCGTARNLRRIARRWPGTRLCGLDAALPMLEIARGRMAPLARTHRLRLEHGTVESLEPQTFGERGFDHVVFSYVLSMVDSPSLALLRALAVMRPGGVLHVVDFGAMDRLPRWFAGGMRLWLDRFGVEHRPSVARLLGHLAQRGDGRLARRTIAGGYAELLRFQKGPHAAGPLPPAAPLRV